MLALVGFAALGLVVVPAAVAAGQKHRAQKPKCPTTPAHRTRKRPKPRRGVHESPARCHANATPAILPIRKGRRVVAHTTAAGPFVGTPVRSFGANGDVDADSAPPLPLGPFIAPPRRALKPLPTQASATRANDPSAHATNVIGDISILQNLRLRAVGQPVATSLAPGDGSEQSVATNGKGLVLYTFNYGAALSTDGGYTFSYLNPGFGAARNAVFPSADGGACCDQVVTYLPQSDRFVWVLQYWVGTGGKPDANTAKPTHPNRIRVATATSAQLLASGGTRWSYRDFTPATFGLAPASTSAAIKLDHPFVAFTRDELYLSVTAVDWSAPTDQRYRPVVWRIPIAQLSTGAGSPDYYVAPAGDGSSLLRPAQNTDHSSHMQYFAGRETTSRLIVWAWPDPKPGPILPLVVGYEIDVPTIATGDESSTLPDHTTDWLKRYSKQLGQVLSGAVVGHHVWFVWQTGRTAVDANGNTTTLHAQPAVEAVAIDTNTLRRVDYAKIEYADVASALPFIRGGPGGDVAITFAWGGGNYYPQYSVGFLGITGGAYADAIGAGGGIDDTAVAGPLSGDYFGLTTDPFQPNCFLSAGSASIAGAAGTGQPLNYRDPHYVVFGRANAHCRLPPPPRKSIASLTITHTTVVGQTIMVTGMIRPSRGHVPVSVVYTPPSGMPVTHTVITDDQGDFSDSLTTDPSQSGSWSISASWAGDSQYRGSQTATPATVALAPPGGSALTMNCSETAAEGQPLTLTATLAPSLQGANVAWSATAPDGSVQSQTVQTDNTSTAYYNVTPTQAGIWIFTAHWAGDSTHTASTGSCMISVQAPSTTTIHCPASGAIAPYNGSVTGTVTPAITATPMSISYAPEHPNLGGTATTHNVTTDASGGYSDSYQFNAADTWTATASFAGDATRAPSTASCTFTLFSP